MKTPRTSPGSTPAMTVGRPAPGLPAPDLSRPGLSKPNLSKLGLSLLGLSILALALGVSSACGSEPESHGQLALTILHTNDTHSRLLEHNRLGGTCGEQERAEGKCFGGIARRKTMIDSIRADTENVLLLDGGDQFQGTLFYSRFKGSETRAAMRHLGYDAMVVGNHEFDDGPEVLGRFIDSVEFPVLGTNIDTSTEPSLDGRFERSVVLDVGGRRVGLVGFITEETSILAAPGPNLKFLPIEETVSEAVDELRAADVDIVIALSHAGFERDRRVAATVPGLDVIVGGHTNTLLSNSAPDAIAPYPTVVEGPDGTPVLVITAFAWGKYLGRLDVVFDGEGVPVEWSGDPILLDARVRKDPDTMELLRPLRAELEAFSGEVVGESTVLLVGTEQSCRAEECNLGNLITDALLEETAPQGVEIALQNGGGIRSSINAGPITVGHVLEVLPFGNTTSTFSLRGGDLLATLEHGVSRAENLDNDGTGRFLQVSGLRYLWKAAAPVGERIEKVEIRQADGSWQPLELDRVYKVAMNAFNRGGGDGFEILVERAIDPYDQGRVLADVVRDYLGRHSPVSPAREGRIVRLN